MRLRHRKVGLPEMPSPRSRLARRISCAESFLALPPSSSAVSIPGAQQLIRLISRAGHGPVGVPGGMSEQGEDDDHPEQPGGNADAEEHEHHGTPCQSSDGRLFHTSFMLVRHGGQRVDAPVEQHRHREDADREGECGEQASDRRSDDEHRPADRPCRRACRRCGRGRGTAVTPKKSA